MRTRVFWTQGETPETTSPRNARLGLSVSLRTRHIWLQMLRTVNAGVGGGVGHGGVAELGRLPAAFLAVAGRNTTDSDLINFFKQRCQCWIRTAAA